MILTINMIENDTESMTESLQLAARAAAKCLCQLHRANKLTIYISIHLGLISAVQYCGQDQNTKTSRLKTDITFLCWNQTTVQRCMEEYQHICSLIRLIAWSDWLHSNIWNKEGSCINCLTSTNKTKTTCLRLRSRPNHIFGGPEMASSPRRSENHDSEIK